MASRGNLWTGRISWQKRAPSHNGGREPTAEELKPFLEDVALENEFRSKYGRGPTWLEYVARFGREPGRQQRRPKNGSNEPD
jgi:hypothetical protein